MSVRIVRLGTPRIPGEGPRIGTVRRPPRGVPKSEFSAQNWYDVWFPNLAPSVETIHGASRPTFGCGGTPDAPPLKHRPHPVTRSGPREVEMPQTRIAASRRGDTAPREDKRLVIAKVLAEVQ